jgi:hypothetical protein
MQTYKDLVELARICVEHARAAKNFEAAAALKRIAKEYQQRAAELNGGELPYIGGGIGHLR